MHAANSTAAPSLPCPPEAVDLFLSEPSPAVIEVVRRLNGPVLVLGAGGKIGLHLSLMLRRAMTAAGRTDAVTAVSRFRTLHDRSAFEDQGVRTIACDLSDAAAVAALPDAPTVFFLAGVKFGTAAAPELLRQMNVDMPGIVAERYRSSRIVAFSTGCVYPFVTPESGGATEQTPVAPVGEYAQSCLEREHAFAAVSRQHGTAVALIRLNYSVEFRYGILLDVATKVLRGDPIDLTTGYVNVIWQRDAVDFTIRSLDLAGSPAVPVNITGPGVLTVRSLAERLGVLLERRVTFTGQEAPTAWLNDASMALARFGAPQARLDDMLAWTAAWLRRGGETWGKPTGFERRNGQF